MAKRELRIFVYEKLKNELGTFERWEKYDGVEVIRKKGTWGFIDENGRRREVEKQWTVPRETQLKMIL